MRTLTILTFLSFLPVFLYSQEERKHIREGYRAYMDEQYNEAEIAFRKAEDANKGSYIARYNTSTALYQQDKLEESGKRFADLLASADSKEEQAKILHNLGNVLMKGQQYSKAAESYKESLRLNPGDEDTRYNLAYALAKLKDQQQEQQKNQDQQSGDQKENDQQQEQQNKNQQEEDQNQQQQQQQQSDTKKEEKNDQQIQQQQLSKEEAERLLQAILQKEMDVKEKVDKQKAAAKKIKTDKDW